jgi:hypothetical protein
MILIFLTFLLALIEIGVLLSLYLALFFEATMAQIQP